jgi:hypothetical protein
MLRSRQRTRVVWTSGRVARHGRVYQVTRRARASRIRRLARTAFLLTVIAMVRLARTVHAHLRPSLSLAGTAITLAGVTLPSKTVLIAGFLILFLAMFLPSERDAAPAKPCSARLWSEPLTSWARRVPPPPR